MLVLPFHNIDPVIFRINESISLNWYGISYLVVFYLWDITEIILQQNHHIILRRNLFSDFVVWE